MFPIAERHFACNNRGQNAIRLLLEPPRAGGQIIFDGGNLRRYGCGVEDVDIRDAALAQQAAAGEAPRHGGCQGDHFYGFLQRERLPLAHPVRKQVRVYARIHDQADMRTGIRERHHRARVTQGGQCFILALGYGGDVKLHEQLIQVGFNRQVHHHFHRINVALLRQFRHGGVAPYRIAEHIHIVVVGLAWFAAAGPINAVFGGVDKTFTALRIAEGLFLFLNGKATHLFPFGEVVKLQAPFE